MISNEAGILMYLGGALATAMFLTAAIIRDRDQWYGITRAVLTVLSVALWPATGAIAIGAELRRKRDRETP